MSSKEELIVIEHDVNSEDLLEKSHEFDTMRMLLKYSQRLERNIKKDLEMKILEDNEGVMEDRQVGMFNMTYQSQRRINNSKAKSLCYNLGMNPEMFKKSQEVTMVGPSEENGLLTFVRYTQMIDEIKKRDPELKDIFSKIENPDSEDLVEAFESVWALRKHLEDSIKEVKKELKEGVEEYMDSEKGFNPQMDKAKMVMNNNIAYETRSMSTFSGKKFMEVVHEKFQMEYLDRQEYNELKELGELDDPEHEYDEDFVKEKNLFRKKVYDIAAQKMEEDVKEKSLDIIKKHLVKDILNYDKEILLKIQNEDDTYDNIEDGEPVNKHKMYDYCLDVLPTFVANKFESLVDDMIKDKMFRYEHSPTEYLEQHVKNEVNFLKFDPPRGWKSPESHKKQQLLNQAGEFVKSIEDIALSATPDNLSYLADRMDKCQNAGIDFKPFQHINREKIPQIDGIEKSIRPRRDVDIGMGM